MKLHFYSCVGWTPLVRGRCVQGQRPLSAAQPGRTALSGLREGVVSPLFSLPLSHIWPQTHTERERVTFNLHRVCVNDLCSLSLPSTLLIALIPSGGFLFGCFCCFNCRGGGVRCSKISTCVFFHFQCSFFFKLIRPHAHAVEIVCGQHLIMNVCDFFSLL